MGASYKQFAFWREDHDEISKLHSGLTRHDLFRKGLLYCIFVQIMNLNDTVHYMFYVANSV